MAVIAGSKGVKPPDPKAHALVAGSKGVSPPSPRPKEVLKTN